MSDYFFKFRHNDQIHIDLRHIDYQPLETVIEKKKNEIQIRIRLLFRLGSDPQKLFPYEAFLDQFRKFGVYAAFVGAVLLPILCADVDSMPDIDKISETGGSNNDGIYNMSDEQAYNKRVTDQPSAQPQR